MRITKKVSPFLALAALASGLGSLSLIQQPKTQAVLATDSSSSSSTITDTLFTPGSYLYLNILSTSWYNSGANRFALRFVDGNSAIVFFKLDGPGLRWKRFLLRSSS